MEASSSSSRIRIPDFQGEMSVKEQDVEVVRSAITKKFDVAEYIQEMDVKELEDVATTMATYRGFSDQVVLKLFPHDEQMKALEVYVYFIHVLISC